MMPQNFVTSCKFAIFGFMDKVLKIVSLKDKQTDFAYWSTKSPMERLAAIELLREQYMKFKKDVQPRLQRVCRIINQE
jgi:hypothetical protein